MISIYRLYVGLSRADQQEPVDGDRVVSWLATHLEAFTVVAATGFFQGVNCKGGGQSTGSSAQCRGTGTGTGRNLRQV